MKVTVFGASGAIGKLLVALALEKGYLVNAYVRNPAKLDQVHPNLKLFQGELNDYLRIKEAVSGVDAVVSTLGPVVARSYEGFPVLDGHKNIIRAMQSEKVRRFITIATPSIKFYKDKKSVSTIFPGIMAKLFLPKAYKEIVQIGEAVTASDLDWTIVRFIAPNNNPGTGKVKVGFGDTKMSFGIARADIAGFILDEITNTDFIKSMPIIGS